MAASPRQGYGIRNNVPPACLDAIEAAYAAAQAPQQWPSFVRTFAQLLDTRHATLLVGTPERPDAHVLASTDAGRAHEYLGIFHAVDPFRDEAVLERMRGAARAYLSQELIDSQRLRASSFYQDFWRRWDDLFWSCGGHFETPAGIRVTLAAMRPRARKRFGEAERSLANIVLPHVLRAATLGVALDELRRRSALQTRTIDQLVDAVIVLDDGDHVVQLNARARALMKGRVDAEIFSARALKLAGAHERERLGAAIALARSSRLGSAHLLSLHRAPPDPSLNATVVGEHDGYVYIFLRDPRWRTPPSTAALMSEFRLTLAQATLCLHLLRDQNPEEIAAELGVNVNTVRAQLKAVMQKTGIHRVAQLVRHLAIALPATDEGV